MAEYDSSIALAIRLIKRKGAAVALREQRNDAAPDLSKPWRPGPLTEDTETSAPPVHAAHGVFLDYSVKEIDDEKILRGDQRVYMYPPQDGYEPSPRDVLLRGGLEHRIVAILPLKPGDQVVMYELQVRQ